MAENGKVVEDGPIRELALAIIDVGWDTGPNMTSLEASHLAHGLHAMGYRLDPRSPDSGQGDQ